MLASSAFDGGGGGGGATVGSAAARVIDTYRSLHAYNVLEMKMDAVGGGGAPLTLG